MKRPMIVLIVIVALPVALFLAKDVLASALVTGGIGAITGLKAKVASAHLGIFNTRVGLKGLKVMNPRGFKDRVMFDAEELYADYELGSFLQGRAHIQEMRLSLTEFNVIRNEKGELNLDSVKALKAAKAEKKEKQPEKAQEIKKGMPSIKIDVLNLKVGRVIYKDYSKGGEPEVQTFDVNVDERFENITDPTQLVSLIAFRTLASTSIARLANLDLGPFQDAASTALMEAAGFSGSVKDAAAKTADALKKILPFGQ